MQQADMGSRKITWLVALALLGLGGLGAILLTEAAQIINLPRSWVFWFYEHKDLISLFLIVATVVLVYLHRRSPSVPNWIAGAYVFAMIACLFFIHFFAPYVWLRAQQHDAMFIPVTAADKLLQPDTDVLVLEVNGDARAYPRDWIMVPHIAGDNVGGEEVAMTYCALSNLPQAFTTEPAGQRADYRVIAQVHNNLIFADTNTGELYQQITGRGEYADSQPKQYPVQRMPWHAFKSLYPQGKVFKPHDRALDRLTAKFFNVNLQDHYAGDPLFPTVAADDERLPSGEPVWGMLEAEDVLAVPHSRFGDEDELLYDTLGGREIVIAWFAEYETLGAFFADRNGQSLAVTEVDPYGNSNAGKLERVHLFPGVLWMVWSHWYPDSRTL